MTPRVRQGGFTLLEVVLAVALSAGVLAALFVFHRQVLAMRGVLLEETQVLSAERILMDRLTAELRSAVPVSYYGLVFEGSDTHMVFHYTDVPNRRVRLGGDGWVAQPQGDIKRLTYRLLVLDEEGDDASVDTSSLSLSVEGGSDAAMVLGVERLVEHVIPLPLEEDEEEELSGHVSLFDQFRFLSLRYWDGDAWVYSWGGGDLPAAVEVTLGIQPLPEGVNPAEYPYPTFRRVIALPTSQLRQVGLSMEEVGPLDEDESLDPLDPAEPFDPDDDGEEE